jgi:hypothetical protein
LWQRRFIPKKDFFLVDDIPSRHEFISNWLTSLPKWPKRTILSMENCNRFGLSQSAIALLWQNTVTVLCWQSLMNFCNSPLQHSKTESLHAPLFCFMWQVTMVKDNWNGQDQINSSTGRFHAYSPVQLITKKKKDALYWYFLILVNACITAIIN